LVAETETIPGVAFTSRNMQKKGLDHQRATGKTIYIKRGFVENDTESSKKLSEGRNSFRIRVKRTMRHCDKFI